MHGQDFDINMENLSKIEGHANLDIKVRNGRVEDVKLQIAENKRFYTRAVLGKSYLAIPQLMSRICGTCSIAHLICSIEAVESALSITPSAQTIQLRKLSTYGMMIRDHALHLYLFALPDVFGKDSLLDFDENNEKEHKLVHDCFEIKAAGSALSNLVAGRAVHATYPVVGGFVHFPDKEETKNVLQQLKAVRSKALDAIDVFKNAGFSFERKATNVALMTKDFSFLDGTLKTSTGEVIEKKDYFSHLEKVLIPYSTASAYKLDGKNSLVAKEYFVGALARLNLNKEALHPNTKKDASEALKLFPSNNIYFNNVAQAIELLHSIDHSIELLENNEFKPEAPVAAVAKESEGVGLIEAPRGGVFHHYKISADGKITYADVMTPTSQNQIHMENSVRLLVQNNIGKSKEWLQYEIEKLIRAYDPCMSCATHFLRIKWR
jgi:sulfhydrogenase subunit alpha